MSLSVNPDDPITAEIGYSISNVAHLFRSAMLDLIDGVPHPLWPCASGAFSLPIRWACQLYKGLLVGRDEGKSVAAFPFCLRYSDYAATIFTMQQPAIERLKAKVGRNNELTYCECFLDDEDWSFYVKPLTMIQMVEARKSYRKNEELSDLEMSVKLFMLRALDANGNRIYQSDAFNLLMRMPMPDLLKLISAMSAEEEEDVALDIKSADEGVETGKPVSSGTGRSGKAGKNAD